MKRLLITGIRPGGRRQYTCRIVGNPRSDFPPISVDATLQELGRWLRQLDPVPPAALGGEAAPRRAVLRVVS